MLVRAWQPAPDRVVLRAEAVDPARGDAAACAADGEPAPAGAARAASWRSSGCASCSGSTTTSREFHRRFRRDPLLGPLIRRMPELPAAAPGLALGGARGGGRRAADRGRARGHDRAPHRRPLGAAARGGARRRCATSRRRRRSPAAPRPNWPRWTSRRTAPRRCAGSRRRSSPAVAAGSSPPAADRRLLAIPQIGPWTVQCLGLFGRGEMDSLPAGDLGYIKLVGRLAGLGRRATRRRGGGVLRAV